MKKMFVFLVGIWCLAYGALAQSECSMAFEVTVHEGPSAGLVVAGILTYNIGETGTLTGTLTREDGPVVIGGSMSMNSLPVTGQVNGRAVNLLFILGDDLALAGIGTASGDLMTCSESDEVMVVGPAVGPQPSDRGDWRGRRGRRPCVFIRDPVFGDQRICVME